MRKLNGWKPDMPDGRDYVRRFSLVARAALPKFVNLRPLFKPVPVSDQGDLGSCTAQAWCDTLEYLRVAAKQPHEDYSRLFVYYAEREIEGTVGYDEGAQIRTGAKVLAKIGAPTEALWPYDIAKFAQKPPDAAYTDAPRHKLLKYQRLMNLVSIKCMLAKRIPVVFGFAVYESFMDARSGVIPFPVLKGVKREQLLGGHAVVAVGYNDNRPYGGSIQGRGVVICRNSWGPQWGAEGYFFLPYPFFQRGLTADHWTAESGTFTAVAA